MADARRTALAALTHITSDKLEVEDALARTDFATLDAREKGFAFTLVMTCLRWGRACDHILMEHMETLLPDRKQRAKWAMRMGVVQLRVLGTPDHAAVSETVDLLKDNKSDNAYAGLTNAVLKKIASERTKVEPRKAFPFWMEKKWRKAYGDDDFVAMANVMAEEPSIDLTVPKDIYKWEEELKATRVLDVTLRMPAETSAQDLPKLPGYAEGAWWVQDAAAAIPVQLLGNVKDLKVLDLCAAPGGKTAQLCVGGGQVVAVDRSPSRVKRLKENMARLKMTPQIIEADVLKWKHSGVYDAILLDAPCSATGTIRRHPEIGWIRGPEDHDKLVTIQREMLEKAWEWLRPGGRLIYSVCSLQPEEGEQQMERFRNLHKDAAIMRPVMSPGIVPDAAWTPEQTLHILPHYDNAKGGYDGFFTACIVKLEKAT